jgi:hypothetical protein
VEDIERLRPRFGWIEHLGDAIGDRADHPVEVLLAAVLPGRRPPLFNVLVLRLPDVLLAEVAGSSDSPIWCRTQAING